jgi:hypothetical protein
MAAALMVLGGALNGALAAAHTSQSARSGSQLYREACAACHGIDGKGAAPTTVGFDVPLPDFTDCSFATREPDADWFAIAHAGGPVRAFDRRMPAFGEALDPGEIQRTIDHLRTFCREGQWPRGELNLPRPLVTEKAFPEDEVVLTTTVATRDRIVSNEFLYERRIGARNQLEVAIPLAARGAEAGGWQAGIGDVAVALKRVLAHSLERGRVLSVTGEVVLPTGTASRGLGQGVTVFEPFVTFGQLLPGDRFVHGQAGAGIPGRGAVEGFWRAAVGQTFEQQRFGRAWSPMIELLGAREFESGRPIHWDVVPQAQITLSRRQHIMINGGVRVPVTARADRGPQVVMYFLWDWFDGGLLDGWR